MEAESEEEAVARPLSPHLSLYHCQNRPYRPNVLSRPRPHAPRPPGSLTENDKRPAREGVRLVGGRLPQGHMFRARARDLGRGFDPSTAVLPGLHLS